MLESGTREIVKSTVPVLAEHGETITRRFYARMFEAHPELRNVFNQAHQAAGEQPQALARAVMAWAEHIDEPQVLEDTVRRIAHKHVSLRVTADQYAIVGEHLLGAMGEVLGEAATPEIVGAWEQAYWELARILIDAEQSLYDEQAAQTGGWTGWRRFRIHSKMPESREITSFELVPEDGGAIPEHRPGQYVSVRMDLLEEGIVQPRQYSLTHPPGSDALRISVKREAGNGAPDGRVSGRLHDALGEGDCVEVSAPAGDFVLPPGEHPLVLVAGGVGITPLLSMLHELDRAGMPRPVTLLHGVREREVRAFAGEIEALRARHPERLKVAVFLEDGDAREPHEYAGRVDPTRVASDMLPPAAEVRLSGPLPFIRDQRDRLTDAGIPPERIVHEVFGPDVLQ
ncbi:NO-inducible flavohemoprotein [Thioalkalivibrio sp. ALE11]|uniref:NO-inducible flavohemoprotein n=1 Tax=Thioalkalivibrio sp. ALE11 TaxID=1265494 RepID=UPI0003771510|nr:NO-inducible flavohemoprotein [Thioalkalivibrio sp. ALE11]